PIDAWIVRQPDGFSAFAAGIGEHLRKSHHQIHLPAVRALFRAGGGRKFHLIEHRLKFRGWKCANHGITAATSNVGPTAMNPAKQKTGALRIAETRMGHKCCPDTLIARAMAYRAVTLSSQHPGFTRAVEAPCKISVIEGNAPAPLRPRRKIVCFGVRL